MHAGDFSPGEGDRMDDEFAGEVLEREKQPKKKKKKKHKRARRDRSLSMHGSSGGSPTVVAARSQLNVSFIQRHVEEQIHDLPERNLFSDTSILNNDAGVSPATIRQCLPSCTLPMPVDNDSVSTVQVDGGAEELEKSKTGNFDSTASSNKAHCSKDTSVCPGLSPTYTPTYNPVEKDPEFLENEIKRLKNLQETCDIGIDLFKKLYRRQFQFSEALEEFYNVVHGLNQQRKQKRLEIAGVITEAGEFFRECDTIEEEAKRKIQKLMEERLKMKRDGLAGPLPYLRPPAPENNSSEHDEGEETDDCLQQNVEKYTARGVSGNLEGGNKEQGITKRKSNQLIVENSDSNLDSHNESDGNDVQVIASTTQTGGANTEKQTMKRGRKKILPEEFYCEPCKKKFGDRSNYNTHRKKAHGFEPQKCRITPCNYPNAFWSQELYQQHWEKVHKPVSRKDAMCPILFRLI